MAPEPVEELPVEECTAAEPVEDDANRFARVRSVLTGQRLFWAVVVALLGPAFVVAYGLRMPPHELAPETQPRPTAVLPQVPPGTARTQLDRSSAADRLARTLSAPTLVAPQRLGSPPAAGDLPSLVLAPRVAAYTLAEVAQQVPAGFGPVQAGQPLLVRAHIEVPEDTTLVIDDRTPQVALITAKDGFATIMSRGQLTITGTAQTPVVIASRDADGKPDTDVTDGRPFVLQAGNRMDVDHATFDSLGFGTGTTSGVSWNGAGGGGAANAATNRATGTVRNSTFVHNQFGVYTHEAEGLYFGGNTFRDNIEYGFDPHDFSNDFVVENNVAFGNGKHGFIFSRGCAGNVLRNNAAHDNVGHGFMIDDGRSEATDVAQARVDPSNDNQVVDNVATHNGNNGVEVEGGTGNVVANNQLVGNFIGVRTKNDARVEVRDNTIADSVRYGIDVEDPDNQVPVSGNQISGSWGGISLTAGTSAVVDDNSIKRSVNAPLVVDGVADRDRTWFDHVVTFIRWNPLLLVWTVVVLFPLIMWVLRRVLPALVHRRRPAVHA